MRSWQDHIIHQVPPDYYQNGIKKNLLQRIWHSQKLSQVTKDIHKVQNNPASILDVGCASGWFVNQLHKEFVQANCYGVDVYEKAITYGKKKYPKVQFKKANAEELPFTTNFFDIVICTEVLEHVENPPKVLKEIKRVLKKNRYAVIELDSGSWLFSIVWYLWRKFNGKVWNDSHLHSFTVNKLEKAILESGFTIVSKRTFNLGMAMVFTIKK